MFFQGAQIRNERRIRLLFTSALAIGAFGSTGSIAVQSTDGVGADPNVIARFAVPGFPNILEIALDTDLQHGGEYELDLTGIPGADSTTVTVTEDFAWSAALPDANLEVQQIDVDALVYLRDLISSGGDWLEDANGDLAQIEGLPNVIKAMENRVLSDGIPWDPTYGGKPREYVDGPLPALSGLLGISVQQVTADPRIASAKATSSIPSSTSAMHEEVVIRMDMQPRGTPRRVEKDVRIPIRQS